MASRHEEKFILDYRQYSIVRSRAEASMLPDPHGNNGSYLITSIYYDDRKDTALDEKLDGIKIHTKYRVRSYDCSPSPIQLERKVKRGIMTEKHSGILTLEQIPWLSDPSADLLQLGKRACILGLEMRSKGLIPKIIVRYQRDAFVFPEMDCRLTFDTNVEALPPDPEFLIDDSHGGIPAMGRDQVIMEVKYGEHLPAFIRKLTQCESMQLSVSKYALCRDVLK